MYMEFPRCDSDPNSSNHPSDHHWKGVGSSLPELLEFVPAFKNNAFKKPPEIGGRRQIEFKLAEPNDV